MKESIDPAAKGAPPLTARDEHRLGNLDILRAVAALLVCLYHFDSEKLLGLSSIGGLSRIGYLGVNMFFVISGFVIPLALWRSGFRYRDIGTFFLARFIRLYPAYAAAAILAVVLWHVSAAVPGFAGRQPELPWEVIWTNATLTSDLLGQPWILPLFWTLAIEAQYYVLIALSLPLLVSRNRWLVCGALAFWICAPLVAGQGPTVFSWTALFMLGICVFLHREKLIPAAAAVAVFGLAAAVETRVHGLSSALFGSGTAAFIAFCPALKTRGLVAIGLVSYSLYLVHTITGGRVVNLATRVPHEEPSRLFVLLVAVVVSIAAAAMMYFIVEKPSHAWSRRFRPGRGRKAKC
jgi:peptidoglycan/LPS O-acetylase OafA/YrhL